MKKEFRNRSIISRILFSRLIVTFFLLLIQAAVLFSIFKWLAKYSTYMVGGLTLLSIVLIIYLVNNDENPAYKLAWILPIAIFPVMGSLLYLYVKSNVGAIGLKKAFHNILNETQEWGVTSDAVREDIRKEDSEFEKISRYIEVQGGYATYRNSKVEYYPLGDDCFEVLKEELSKAKKFIFMEYFIIEEGIFWDSILEILEQKVKEGVEVRVMYDDLGCVALLPRNYVEILKKKGIKAKAFSQLKPMLSTHYNNRDHRKITVIDGEIAFNGGINLADEYINQKEVFGHWKDTAYKVTGEAVLGYMQMFLQMWNVLKDTAKTECEQYMKEVPRLATNQGQGYVIPFGDGPHQKENVAENVYMDIIHHAKKYVDIMTPYLILDNEMLQAILHAAKRGVRVRLLLPNIPDKWFAIVIARSYYPKLIAAGVEVYQYTPGFVHAKMFLADDEIAVVGTINLDFRSLYLHFECGGLFYHNPAIVDIVEDFNKTFKKSQRISYTMYKKTKLFDRVSGHVLKLIGPLM